VEHRFTSGAEIYKWSIDLQVEQRFTSGAEIDDDNLAKRLSCVDEKTTHIIDPLWMFLTVTLSNPRLLVLVFRQLNSDLR
jgi:hypothetical protein